MERLRARDILSPKTILAGSAKSRQAPQDSFLVERVLDACPELSRIGDLQRRSGVVLSIANHEKQRTDNKRLLLAKSPGQIAPARRPQVQTQLQLLDTPTFFRTMTMHYSN